MLQKFIIATLCIIITVLKDEALAQNETTFVPELRIVGGHNARLTDRPFQVSIQKSSHFCGGSIINRYYVLTAAHCLVDQVTSQLRIVVGTIDLRRPYATYKVSKVIVHRSYNGITSKNDIGLIRVSSPMKFSSNVRSVALPIADSTVAAGTPAVVSGWGRLKSPTSARPDILQEVTIYITNQQQCVNAMRNNNRQVYNTNICASYPSGRRGHCSGDSGGPLTVNNVLVGVVSWSVKDPNCASPKYPGVYTRVSKYIGWIRSNTN